MTRWVGMGDRGVWDVAFNGIWDRKTVAEPPTLQRPLP